MVNVTVSGRLIQNLPGLKADLLAKGFKVEYIVSDNNAGKPYTTVYMVDAGNGDPTADVKAFVDSPPQGGGITVRSPDGSSWAVRVNNNGAVSTSKIT